MLKCFILTFSRGPWNPRVITRIHTEAAGLQYSFHIWRFLSYPAVKVLLVEKLKLCRRDAACGENAILGRLFGVTAGNPEIRRTGVGRPDRLTLAGVMDFSGKQLWNTLSSEAFRGVLTAMALEEEHALAKTFYKLNNTVLPNNKNPFLFGQ